MNEYLMNNHISFKRETPLKYIWFIVLTVIILSIVFLNLNVNKTLTLSGMVEKDNILLYVPYKDVINITKNKNIIINNENYFYKIKDISELMEINNQNIQIVYLDIKLPNNYKENLILETKLILENKKMYKLLYEILIEKE